MLVLSAVAMLGVACDRSEKVGETYTTSASPSVPAEANPAPLPVAPLDPSLAPGAAPVTPTPAPKPAGQMATPGAGARVEAKDAGAGHVHMNAPAPLPREPRPASYDGNVGPGHIITPALPGEPRATGAPNNDGSHNIGTTH